jgi:membrane-associated protein
MDFINFFVEFFLHIDKHLNLLIQDFGVTNAYLIICLVIFCETGLVVTPFLPGDSLLFALGALAASGGGLKVELLMLFIWLATICGDSTNYWIGYFLGSRMSEKDSRFIKKEHLERTHRFYEKHGGKTIILARYLPIIRTFAPFVAGIGKMKYHRFITYSFIGSITWISIFILAGYFFGNLPFVKRNFSIVVIAIISISLIPAFLEFVHQRRQRNNAVKGVSKQK